MNIIEQADRYAEGKANDAITKAIAAAYIEGYKAGYKDREEEIPLELRDEKTEYVDLGLPSHTLWSIDYEKLNGERLYLPYIKADLMKLPTKEQWKELFTICKWEFDYYSDLDLKKARCVGPNGQILTFDITGMMKSSGKTESYKAFFWLKNDNENNEKESVRLYNDGKYRNFKSGYGEVETNFSGYRLPVRTVR